MQRGNILGPQEEDRNFARKERDMEGKAENFTVFGQ